LKIKKRKKTLLFILLYRRNLHKSKLFTKKKKSFILKYFYICNKVELIYIKKNHELDFFFVSFFFLNLLVNTIKTKHH